MTIKLDSQQQRAASEIIDILLNYGLCYLAGEVRSGKTLTALNVAADFNHLDALFVTKKKAISSIKKDMDLIGYHCDIINYASLHKITDKYELVIIDEAHSLGAFPKPSKRTRQLKAICAGAIVLLMSGTPSPESWSQRYHQLWVSPRSPFSQYRNFYAWAKDYVKVRQKYITSMLVNDYSGGIAALIDRDTRHLFVTMTQKEAGFTSYIEEKFLRVPMTDKQKRYYKEMDKHGVIHDLGIMAVNAADKINKLAQISGGTLLTELGAMVEISNNKALAIKDHCKGKRTAIFYKYRAERMVLKNTFGNITEDVDDFNNSDDKIFIGQFTSIREGVNLSTADVIYMHGVDFSATSYWQSRARLQHRDRVRASVIYWVLADGGIDDYVLKCVKGKKNFTSNYYKNIRNILGAA